MAVALDIFALDTDIHTCKSGIGTGEQEDIDNVTDIFAIIDDRQDSAVNSGVRGRRDLSGEVDMHPISGIGSGNQDDIDDVVDIFAIMDDHQVNRAMQGGVGSRNNLPDLNHHEISDVIDIFAIEDDQPQNQGIKCLDLGDGKLAKGNRESGAGFEHYVDFISYLSDEGDNNARNLEPDQQQRLSKLDFDQEWPCDKQVLARSSSSDDTEEDETCKAPEDIDDTKGHLEDTYGNRSDTESSESYTVEAEEYYNGSETSTEERGEEYYNGSETSTEESSEVEEEERVVDVRNEGLQGEDDGDGNEEEEMNCNSAPESDSGSEDNVMIMLFPSERIKIRTLHDLLPDFQKFLDDLCQIKLTSDLEEKAQFYRQRITDYIEQFSSMPGAVPPPLPDPSTFPRDSDPNLDELIAEERIRSRQQFSNTLPISLSNGHSSHGELFLSEKVPDELKRQSAPPGFRLSKRLSGHFLSKRRSLIVNQPEEDFYEAPMDQTSSVPPPVPDSERPPVAAIRQIDDLPAYDDPDSPQMSPPPVTGHPPSLPRPSSSSQGYHVLNPEGQDSGGTFTMSTKSSVTEDGELYEDLNDGEYDDSFSDYESDELEVLNPDTDSGVISPSSTKEKKKKKKDDWQNFLNFIEAENHTCDHTGRLHFYDAKSTLKNIFKPKVYFCAATNARLLGYLPKKDYGKPQFDIQLTSGCEISPMGKDSNKEYGIQVQLKKGKTYNFTSSSQMDADKWVETLKKYTNQGLEYDVTHVTEPLESVDTSDPTSPPTGVEDPMIGKFETLMKKVFKNKKKKHPEQITEEDGALQGFANVMGALYGEPKWQKKWIMIRNHQFSCHKSKGEDYEFSFSLKDVELGAPEQKIVKKGREGALKFHKDNETLMYLEALNPLDVGKIMKQALNAMMVSSAASKSSLVKRETTVEKITKFYEALESGVNEQQQPFARRKKETTVEAQKEEEEPEEEVSKKEKKKKKDKKDKKKKKSKKDEIEHPDEPPPDPPQSYDTPQPAKQPVTRTLTVENKFKDSDKKHLLDADRLQGEKKDVEARKKDLAEKKKDIQNKRKSADDQTEKANLDQQFKSVQAEWSKCSKRLAELEEEIEKATKAAVPQTQLMKNSPASLRRGREGSDSRRSSASSHGTDGAGASVGSGLSSMTSPERECLSSDMSLQEKIKRFQQK